MKAILYDNGVEVKRAEYPREDMALVYNLQVGLEWKLIERLAVPVYDSLTHRIEYRETVTDLPHPDYPHLKKVVIDYEVIPLAVEEIQQIKIGEAEQIKQSLIQQKLEEQLVAEAQLADDTVSLDSQALFPLWVVGQAYTIGFKCNHFTVDNELVLYKCVQAHTSQSDWQPKDVPALFTRVAYPNQILAWVQPTGAQDAYNIGDQVHFPTLADPIYESLINANVWSPTGYPAGWQLIS